MTREMQTAVGGIALLIGLGALQWWLAKMGAGPRRFFWQTKPVFRDMEPRRFWRMPVYYACLTLILVVALVLSVGHVLRAG